MSNEQIQTREIHQNTNCVFLLGAGASAAYGLPLMREFIDAARNCYFRRKLKQPKDEILKCYESLLNFHIDCRNSSWALERDWENIEELYTQADLLRLTTPDESDSFELCNNIAWAIWDQYRQRPSAQLPIKDLIDNKPRSMTPVFITTNYDLVLEQSLTGTEFSYPGLENSADPTIRQYKSSIKTLHIPIIKLHGSVNWFNLDKSSTWFAYTSHNVSAHDRTLNQIKQGIAHTYNQVAGSSINPTDITPGIIPPMLESRIRCQEP